MSSPPSLSHKMMTFLGSRRFFIVVVALFAVESAWIALSARYPQAFDEQFHLGIIKLYAHQYSPFFSQQPVGADMFGAVARDPSYLYHYLMSFPYRLIAHFSGSLAAQVIILRFINIALLGSSLFIFKKVLRYTGASAALINTVLFFFVLIPVVPLLASQINYDNLMVPLAGLAIWGCLQFLEHLRTTNSWRWGSLGQLAILCLLGSLVKYAFLPIFVALTAIIFLAWVRHRLDRPRYLWPSRPKIALLTAGILVSLGLFVQMYGVNAIRYHTPIPECDQVLSVERCQAYAPWARNYSNQQHKASLVSLQIVGYPILWLYYCMGELIFTIGSGFNGFGTVDYWVGTQLIGMEILAWGAFGAGVLAVLRYGRRLWQQEALRVLLVVSGLYVLALVGQNYLDYLSVGEPVAIHGRYVLPVLPLILVAAALAFRQTFRTGRLSRLSAMKAKAGLTSVLMVLLLVEGGGFTTYIIRSEPRWLWPQSTPAQTINAHAQKLLKSIVLDVEQS